MNRIEYKQAIYVGEKFDRWHYWGFMPDLTFVGPDMTNGIAHALENSHPFGCNDKNGEKVFAGDEAVGVMLMESPPPYQVKGKVEYYKASFCIASNGTYYQINDLLEIELIKEQA